MNRDIHVITTIQEQKEKDIAKRNTRELTPEVKKLAEHKRFTFDVIDIPTDPLR